MLKFFRTINLTKTDETVLSKCPDCGSYYFDRDCVDSCCKGVPDRPGTALMKFLLKRRD